MKGISATQSGDDSRGWRDLTLSRSPKPKVFISSESDHSIKKRSTFFMYVDSNQHMLSHLGTAVQYLLFR